MKIILFGTERNVDNDRQEIDRLFEQISLHEKHEDDHLSVIVDDVEVMEEHYNYMVSRLPDIQEIAIDMKSFRDIALESLLLTEQYLERATPALRELIQEFYANPTAVSWAELEQLLEGILWVHQMSEGLNRKKIAAYEPIIDRIQTFGRIIPDLEQALEDRDHTLIADVLNYDILQQLITLKQEIRQYMDDEVAAHDIS